MESIVRKQLRMPVVWKATLVRLNGERLSGSTDNISTTGLNVIVAKELVIGEPVRVDIVTPCHMGTRFFKLDGVVVYLRGLDQNLGYAVGFKLLQPTGEYVGFVEMLEQKKEKRPISNSSAA